MSTVEKAYALLGFFSEEKPELGLSELRRLSGRDKATTYRYLEALERVGLLEQAPVTRTYRIGPAVLRLARLRERTMPRLSVVEALLPELADATGETVHASHLEGDRLVTLANRESSAHSTRVVIDIAELPLHATASGLVVLAYGPDRLREAAESRLEKFTPRTPSDPRSLNAAIAEARDTGIGRSIGAFEEDVHSLSVPLFDAAEQAAGAVAVAALASRMTPELERKIEAELIRIGRSITARWGGQIPSRWTISGTPALRRQRTSTNERFKLPEGTERTAILASHGPPRGKPG